MLTLIENKAKKGAVSEDFDEEYQQLSEHINELKTARIQTVQAQKKAESYKEHVQQLDKAINTVNSQVREFDQDLVKRLIFSKGYIRYETGDTVPLRNRGETGCELL